MFNLKQLFTASEVQESGYVAVASLIDSESVLDRRGRGGDRRNSIDRRQSRRDLSEKISEEPNELDRVEVLEKAYKKVVSSLDQLYISAELKNYTDLVDHISSFQSEIKIYLSLEEEMLHSFVDSINSSNTEEKQEILSIFYKLIYQTGDEVLQLIEPYIGTNSEDNISHLTVAIEKSIKLLSDNHKDKQSRLYKIYRKVPAKKGF